ncbi:MAG: uroporphyrinogen-III synthase [Rhodocyclaceae bacterium]|nr:uroporphyrinogen-III synthase [Rhodocyclaceae bacterium]MBK6906173.1 uroporphyrinogen-III synthase [Rhodocyclaceae bacterium]
MSALAGRHVVVTRPAEQAGHLCAELADRGAIAVRYPVLAISPVEDVTPLLDRAIALDSYQLVVFVSPNAVEHALSVMLRHRSWPIETTAAGMGRSSEAALARYGVGKIIAPQERFDSESLLAMPPLSDVRGWRILICRGDGGRELLGETLSARGAQVDYLTCYRRSRPTLDPAPLIRLWQGNSLDAITLTSSEGVRHFAAMIGHLGLAYWRNTPTFVSHERIAAEAQRFGLHTMRLTEPADAGLLASMEAHFSAHDPQVGAGRTAI